MTAVVHRTRRHHAITGPRFLDRELPPRRPAATVAIAGALMVLGLGFHGVLSGPGDVPASAAGAGKAPAVETVKVHPGDSMWSIAERFHGDVPIQRYVDALVELNGGSARIDAGQLVRLP